MWTRVEREQIPFPNLAAWDKLTQAFAVIVYAMDTDFIAGKGPGSIYATMMLESNSLDYN
jgi:hypothetical protein